MCENLNAVSKVLRQFIGRFIGDSSASCEASRVLHKFAKFVCQIDWCVSSSVLVAHQAIVVDRGDGRD